MNNHQDLKESHAYCFSIALQKRGARKAINDRYMIDSFVAFLENDDGVRFYLFSDFSLLAADDKAKTYRVMNSEAIGKLLVSLYPFKLNNIKELKESDLEKTH